MKKTTYYKTCFNGKGQPPRFIESEGTQEFFTVPGTDSKISLIFEKCSSYWNVTEETTGTLVLVNIKSRKECINQLTPEFLTKIHKALNGHKCLKLLSEYKKSIIA